jgi:hypothetical protein
MQHSEQLKLMVQLRAPPGAHSAEARGVPEVEECSAGSQASAGPEGYSP